MKHSKTITLLLTAVLLLSLCACGSDAPTQEATPAPEASAAPALTPVPTAEPSAAPEPTAEPEPSAAPEDTPAPEAEPEPEPETGSTPVSAPETVPADIQSSPQSALKDTALELVGSDVSALYDAVGYPISSSYAPSCVGDGEDGELVYDGFTVYTFKAASGGETISVVL